MLVDVRGTQIRDEIVTNFVLGSALAPESHLRRLRNLEPHNPKPPIQPWICSSSSRISAAISSTGRGGS